MSSKATNGCTTTNVDDYQSTTFITNNDNVDFVGRASNTRDGTFWSRTNFTHIAGKNSSCGSGGFFSSIGSRSGAGGGGGGGGGSVGVDGC